MHCTYDFDELNVGGIKYLVHVLFAITTTEMLAMTYTLTIATDNSILC